MRLDIFVSGLVILCRVPNGIQLGDSFQVGGIAGRSADSLSVETTFLRLCERSETLSVDLNKLWNLRGPIQVVVLQKGIVARIRPRTRVCSTRC